MDNLSNKVKGHVQQATNMSMTDMVKGTTRLVGNTISLGFKAIGATVYVADKSVRVLGSMGKAAYDETKDGYTWVDNHVTTNKDGEEVVQYPKEPMATKREPQQMEFDFEQHRNS